MAAIIGSAALLGFQVAEESAAKPGFFCGRWLGAALAGSVWFAFRTELLSVAIEGSSGSMVGWCCGNLKGGTTLFRETVNPLEAQHRL